MRHAISVPCLAALFLLAMFLLTANIASAGDEPTPPIKPAPSAKPAPPPKPAPAKPDAALDKIKELGDHLSRALGIAVDLLSRNQVDLLSKNAAALLSGNSPNLLSGNSPNLLSGNKPEVLNGNRALIVTGNTFSLLSNIKVEIHVESSGKNSGIDKPNTPNPYAAPAH
jgi:hypothetical protein